MTVTVDPKPICADPAAEILKAALDIVTGARRQAYGTPEDNFSCIADLWDSYLYRRRRSCGLKPGEDYVVNATDVAAMMALMKIARLTETPDHKDSWQDLAGYAACGHRCAEMRK